MQAAFVDIGLERTAFLHASDIVRKIRNGDDEELPNIRDLIREGDELLVQVVKDPLGNKGARLTTLHHAAVTDTSYCCRQGQASASRQASRTRTSASACDRSSTSCSKSEENDCGAIVRTVAEGAEPMRWRADLDYLRSLWGVIRERGAAPQRVKTLVHEDLSLPLRVLRDLVTSDVERILVDSKDDFEEMLEFAQHLPSGRRAETRAVQAAPSDLRSARHRGRDPKALDRRSRSSRAVT